MTKTIVLRACCAAALASVSIYAGAIKHNLKYYKELHTKAELKLKGNVKKVITYNVPYKREWGEIKEGAKTPQDSIVFDNKGRILQKWEKSRYRAEDVSCFITWNGNEHSVVYNIPKFYDDEPENTTYIYEYDGQSRLSAVTEKKKDQESKVFFKYNPGGGYTSTVYESIDSYGETYNHDSIYEDPYYSDDRSEVVKCDSNGNWIEKRVYDFEPMRILVREIEYYRPGEESVTVNPIRDYHTILNEIAAQEIDCYPSGKENITIIPIKDEHEDDNKVFTSVEEMPVYPGGDAALLADVSKNIRYPSVAQENGIEGKVVVQFVVTKNGSVGEVKVVRGKDPDLDKEAKRVVKTLKKFTPGKMNGNPVNMWYTLPVTFMLPENIR